MRKLFSTAAVTAALTMGFVLSTTAAQAGSVHYVICWTTAGGGTSCANLPRNYWLPGVDKPRIPDGTVEFKLTHKLIRKLGKYIDNDGLLPAHDATIYAPKR